MKREHTPAMTNPERTVFRLSKEEVAEALTAWLTNQGVAVPAGSRFVWTHERFAGGIGYDFTLGIDHEPAKAKGGAE